MPQPVDVLISLGIETMLFWSKFHVHYVHIPFPWCNHHDLPILVKYGTLSNNEQHLISIITKLTDTYQVIFQTINKCNFCELDLSIVNDTISFSFPTSIITKCHCWSIADSELFQQGLTSGHSPASCAVQIPNILLSIALHTQVSD